MKKEGYSRPMVVSHEPVRFETWGGTWGGKDGGGGGDCGPGKPKSPPAS